MSDPEPEKYVVLKSLLKKKPLLPSNSGEYPDTSIIKADKPKKVSTKSMVHEALAALRTRKGVSLRAIKKYLIEKHRVKLEGLFNFLIKKTIHRGVKDGSIIQTRGVGAAGSFNLAPVPKKRKSKPKSKQKSPEKSKPKRKSPTKKTVKGKPKTVKEKQKTVKEKPKKTKKIEPKTSPRKAKPKKVAEKPKPAAKKNKTVEKKKKERKGGKPKKEVKTKKETKGKKVAKAKQDTKKPEETTEHKEEDTEESQAETSMEMDSSFSSQDTEKKELSTSGNKEQTTVDKKVRKMAIVSPLPPKKAASIKIRRSIGNIMRPPKMNPRGSSSKSN